MNSQEDQTPLAVLRGHTDAINCVRFIVDSSQETCTDDVLASKHHRLFLTSGDASGNLFCWDLKSRRTINTVSAHTASTLSINRFPDNQCIVTNGKDGWLHTWSLQSLLAGQKQPLASLYTNSTHFCNSATDTVTDSEFRNTVVSSGSDGRNILLWDHRTARNTVISTETNVNKNSRGMITSLAFCSKFVDSDAVVFAGYEDGTLASYNLATGSEFSSVKVHDQPIFALDISPKGNKIVSGGADNSINSYKSIVESIQNNEATIEPTTMNKPVGEISALSLLLSGSQATNSNEIYQMKRNTIIQSKTAQIPITGTSSIRYRNDGRIIVSAHWDGSIRIFDHVNLRPISVLRHHRESVFAIDFLRDFSTIPQGSCMGVNSNVLFASGSKDCSIALWSTFGHTYKI